MKFPTNTRCLVIWALLMFYVFFIVSYYLSKFREGATGTTGTTNTAGTTGTTTPTTTGTTTPTTTGTTTSKGKMGGRST